MMHGFASTVIVKYFHFIHSIKKNFLILLLPSHMYQYSMTQILITGLVTMHFAPYARGKISK